MNMFDLMIYLSSKRSFPPSGIDHPSNEIYSPCCVKVFGMRISYAAVLFYEEELFPGYSGWSIICYSPVACLPYSLYYRLVERGALKVSLNLKDG